MEGWEVRLEVVIEAARFAPFAWGERDCLSLACATVLALTGMDHWPKFDGRYRSKRQALRMIAEKARSFGDFVTGSLVVEPCTVRMARVGDLLMREQPGMPALGVCVGADGAVCLERGLGFLPVDEFWRAWRVG